MNIANLFLQIDQNCYFEIIFVLFSLIVLYRKAPIWYAAGTEKPTATVVQIPLNNLMEVSTRPIDADACAPSSPTIVTSRYCMIMDESWVIIAVALNRIVKCNCYLNVIPYLFCTNDNK